MYTRVKTEQEIADMRISGQMLATVLQALKPKVVPGVSTHDLDQIAAKELKSLGGKAAFLGYMGFPATICISVNDEIVHGIPTKKRVLKEGDIVGLDFGVNYNGMITDSAITVICGTASKQVTELVNRTEQSLYAGLNVIKGGCKAGDIGNAVETVLKKHGYGIIRDMVGHGVGHEVHEDPNIPNYGRKGSGAKLVSGMTIAVEPMATLGGERVYLDEDGWTIKTDDGSLSAHFEHTVLITDDGCEILTQVA